MQPVQDSDASGFTCQQMPIQNMESSYEGEIASQVVPRVAQHDMDATSATDVTDSQQCSVALLR